MSASGATLLSATYLGADFGEAGTALALDASGRPYVAGFTGSASFPTTPSTLDWQRLGFDAFVTRFNATLGALDYSLVMGAYPSGGSDRGLALAVDAAGAAYVAGVTDSQQFSFGSSLIDIAQGYFTSQIFVAKLDADDGSLVYLCSSMVAART